MIFKEVIHMNLVKKIVIAFIVISGISQQAFSWQLSNFTETISNHPFVAAGAVIGAATGIGWFRSFMNKKMSLREDFYFSLVNQKKSSVTEACKSDLEFLQNKHMNAVGDKVVMNPNGFVAPGNDNAGRPTAFIKLGEEDQSKKGIIEYKKGYSYYMQYKSINGFIDQDGKFIPLAIDAAQNWQATRWVMCCKKGKCLTFVGSVGTGALVGGLCGYAGSKLIG